MQSSFGSGGAATVSLPERRHGPQALDDGRKLFNDQINFRFGIVDAEAETDGSVRGGKRNAHGAKHMGGLQGPGSTGRAGRCADAEFIHHQKNGFAFHEFKGNTACVGKPVVRIAIDQGIGNFLDKLGFQLVS